MNHSETSKGDLPVAPTFSVDPANFRRGAGAFTRSADALSRTGDQRPQRSGKAAARAVLVPCIDGE